MHKEYNFNSNLIVETEPHLVKQIEGEILDTIIEVVEKHASFVGGGFNLTEYKNE